MALQIVLPWALNGMDVGQFWPCLLLFELTNTCLQYALNKPLSDVLLKELKKKAFKIHYCPQKVHSVVQTVGQKLLIRYVILTVASCPGRACELSWICFLENCISYYACFCSPIFSFNICESYFKKTLYFQNEKFQILSKSIWMVSFKNIHTLVCKIFVMNSWIFIIFLPGFCLLLGSRCQMPFLGGYQSI